MAKMSGIEEKNKTANNAPGSSGYLGPGHTSALNPAESAGEFLGLRDQKGAAQARTAFREAEAGGLNNNNADGTTESTGTCNTEDHSFMGRKPGAADNFMGRSFLKDTMDRFTK